MKKDLKLLDKADK